MYRVLVGVVDSDMEVEREDEDLKKAYQKFESEIDYQKRTFNLWSQKCMNINRVMER